ncbi:hypothetical protein [Serratia fonticola]
MSLLLKVTKPHTISAESLSFEMGMRLQAAAAQGLKDKLETGEVKFINGRYEFGASMQVIRPSIFGSRPKKTKYPIA